jgi:hypothetical protein
MPKVPHQGTGIAKLQRTARRKGVQVAELVERKGLEPSTPA